MQQSFINYTFILIYYCSAGLILSKDFTSHYQNWKQMRTKSFIEEDYQNMINRIICTVIL